MSLAFARNKTLVPDQSGNTNKAFYVVYASMKNAFQQNGSSCMIAMKTTSTKNRQYGGSGEISWLGLCAV